MKQMAILIVVMGIMVAMFSGIAMAAASTQVASPCQNEFTTLRSDTESVIITGGKIDKERAGLLKLIDDSQNLASLGKTADAVTKLRDFTVKVDQLEVAGRISAKSANLLRSDAQATIDCLQGSAV